MSIGKRSIFFSFFSRGLCYRKWFESVVRNRCSSTSDSCIDFPLRTCSCLQSRWSCGFIHLLRIVLTRQVGQLSDQSVWFLQDSSVWKWPSRSSTACARPPQEAWSSETTWISGVENGSNPDRRRTLSPCSNQRLVHAFSVNYLMCWILQCLMLYITRRSLNNGVCAKISEPCSLASWKCNWHACCSGSRSAYCYATETLPPFSSVVGGSTLAIQRM